MLHGAIGVRVYHFTVDDLRQVCSVRELNSSDPIRLLRQRVAEQINGNPMNTSSGEDVNQASVQTELVQNVVHPNSGFCSHGDGRDSPTFVLVELTGFAAVLGRPRDYFMLFCSGRGFI